MNISQMTDELFGMMPEFEGMPHYKEEDIDEEQSHNKKTMYHNHDFLRSNKILAAGDEQTDSNTKISYADVVHYQSKSRKSKIAPRSSLQFKLGPPYQQQHHHAPVYSLNNAAEVTPVLTARIDRGFDNVQESWIGYKRNYFTSVASFQIYADDLISVVDFIQDKYFVMFNGSKHEILYFATRLVASCCEDNKEMSLVQHTAKRDKGPQIRPPIHPIIPGDLPSHEIIRDASNIKNDSKKKKYDTDFYLHKNKIDIEEIDPNAIIHQYPADDIIKVARYERVQFCSSINQKRPTNVVKHFKLTTVLGAVVRNDPHKSFYPGDSIHSPTLIDGQKTFVPLISTDTPELIIRGRSPSNYPPNVVESEFQQLVDNNYIEGGKSYEKLFTEKLQMTKRRGKKGGYVKKVKKRASIKFGKKIANPPLLPSSRPTTGNFSNMLSPTKGEVNEREAKLDDENNKSAQEEGIQFMLNDCNDTGEIEKLIFEHIIKENEAVVDERKEETGDIDDELFLDMDKFENDKMTKHTGADSHEDLMFLKMKEGKRSYSESIVMPHFDSGLEGPKKKRSLSTVEHPVKADFLHPHNEFDEFLNMNGSGMHDDLKLEYLKDHHDMYGFERFDDSMLDVKNLPSSKKSDIIFMSNYKTTKHDEKKEVMGNEPRSLKASDSMNFDKSEMGNLSVQNEMFRKTDLNNSQESYF